MAASRRNPGRSSISAGFIFEYVLEKHRTPPGNSLKVDGWCRTCCLSRRTICIKEKKRLDGETCTVV